jgi:hypothetical protein
MVHSNKVIGCHPLFIKGLSYNHRKTRKKNQEKHPSKYEVFP